MTYDQPCFGGDSIQLQQILPQEKVQPFSALLRAVLRENAQQIAVVNIQRPKAGQFPGGFQAADQPDPQDLRRLFRLFPFGAALG